LLRRVRGGRIGVQRGNRFPAMLHDFGFGRRRSDKTFSDLRRRKVP